MLEVQLGRNSIRCHSPWKRFRRKTEGRRVRAALEKGRSKNGEANNEKHLFARRRQRSLPQHLTASAGRRCRARGVM